MTLQVRSKSFVDIGNRHFSNDGGIGKEGHQWKKNILKKTLKNMANFGEMTDLYLLRSSAMPIIARIKPKQICDSS